MFFSICSYIYYDIKTIKGEINMFKKINNRRPEQFCDDIYDGVINNIIDDNSSSLDIDYYDTDKSIASAILELGSSNEVRVNFLRWPCMTKRSAIGRVRWLRELGLKSTRTIVDGQLLVTDEQGKWKCYVLPSGWSYQHRSTYEIIP